MKKIFIIILLCICGQKLCAQSNEYVYQPLVVDGREWLSSYFRESYFKYTIVPEDTLIKNRLYKKILYKDCRDGSEKCFGAIREENKRIYAFSESDYFYISGGQEDEILLYDFNMKVGDRISYPWLSEPIEVAKIDTVLINGTLRRIYYFSGEVGTAHELWIEGIGNRVSAFEPAVPIPTCHDCYVAVHCVSQTGGILYREKEDSPCSCDNTQLIESQKHSFSYSILQNPIRDRCLRVELKDALFSKIELYSFDAKLIINEMISIRNGILEISLINLQAGKYIVILSRPDNSRESAQIIVL